MNYEFGDRSDEKARARKIRELYLPGSTINETASRCVQNGVWTDSELLGMATTQARAEVRDALGVITAEGIPFAGPTPQQIGRASCRERV